MHCATGAGTGRHVYYSAYDEGALQAMAAQVLADTPAKAQAWVIFDNTAHGHAVPDALRFGRIAHRVALGRPSGSTTQAPDLA